MTSNEFAKLLGNFITRTGTFDYVIEFLLTISKHHRALTEAISTLAVPETNVNTAHARLTAFSRAVSEISNSMRTEFHTRGVWAGVEEIGRRSRDLAALPLTQEIGETIGHQLSQFSEAYEQFLKSYSENATFALVDVGNDLWISIDGLRMSAFLSQQALAEPTSELTDGESELTLRFSSSPTLEAFAAKLTALSQIYHKLCELLDVSTATSPLRIVKVETGTWYVKAIGALLPVALLSRLLQDAVHYCYRNYTTEGKLSSLPRKAEAAEAILRLKRGLDEAGIRTTAINANIQNAVIALSQDLNTLIAGEGKIVLNEEELTSFQDGAALQLRHRPLIEDAASISEGVSTTPESDG